MFIKINKLKIKKIFLLKFSNKINWLEIYKYEIRKISIKQSDKEIFREKYLKKVFSLPILIIPSVSLLRVEYNPNINNWVPKKKDNINSCKLLFMNS